MSVPWITPGNPGVQPTTFPPYDFEVFARYYDWDTSGETEDLEFYLNYASRTGSPVLDLACGTGRIALALASSGYEVVGLDVSKAMLLRAEEKARLSGSLDRVRFVQRDMRDFELGQHFALAAVGLNSFMHLSKPADHQRALRRIRDHLVPGGLLILDLFNPDPTILAEADGRLVYDYTRPGPDPGTVTSRFHSQRVDPAHQTLEVTFFYDEVTPQGTLKRTVAPFTMTYFGRHELELLLASADLELEQLLGGYDLEDYWSGSSKMIAVARRV